MRPIIAAHSGPFFIWKKTKLLDNSRRTWNRNPFVQAAKSAFPPETNIGELLMSEELCGALSRGVRVVECSWKRGTRSGKKGDLRAMRSAIQ